MSTEVSTGGAKHMPAVALVAAAKAHAPQALASPAEAARPAPVKATVKPVAKADPAEARRNIEEAVQQLNEQMRKSSRNLNFAVDHSINRIVITVKNAHTGEVVRQIPDEAVMRVAHNIHDLKGLLLNQKV